MVSKSVFIIGATSAIAEKIAQNYADQGCTLYLAARDSDKLAVLSKDCLVRGAHRAETFVWDALSPDYTMFSNIKSLDILLIAHGYMPQNNSEVTEIFNVNLVSVVQILEHITSFFEKQGYGTIGAISSVAGERTRSIIRCYASAKAGLTAYLSGLRQRLQPHNVHVVSILPGRVYTPMTAHLPKTIVTAEVKTVANQIIEGIEKKKDVIYTPQYWRLICFILRCIPEKIWKHIVAEK